MDEAIKAAIEAKISIHTPVKGVTILERLNKVDEEQFQSTHP